MNKKIKLLYGVECFGGGVLKHILHLVEGIDRNIFEIHIISSNLVDHPEAVEAGKYLQSMGIEVRMIKIKHSICILSDFKCIREIIKYIRNNKIDLIHAHSTKAGFLFRLAALHTKTPVIYTPHCFYFNAVGGIRKKLVIMYEKLFQKISCKIVVSTNEYFQMKEMDFDMEKISVIDNAINPRYYVRYDGQEVRKKYGIPLSGFVAVGIGRLCRQKDWNLFLDMATCIIKNNHDAFFVIAGDGPQKKQLLSRISGIVSADRILMTGYIQNISEIYSMADLFVSTSLWEGLPYTYLEAAHYMLPMIIRKTPYIETALNYSKSLHFFQGDDVKVAVRMLDECMDTVKGGNSGSIFDFPGDDNYHDFIKSHEELYRSVLVA